MSRFLAIACGWLVLLLPLQAELWTNQAGRVIDATLEKFDGASVTFVRTNGSRLVLPLLALTVADQQRVKLKSGHTVVPVFVQAAYRDACSVLDRFGKLPAAQRSDNARTKATRMACAVFDARLEPRQQELKDPEVRREIKRLRASLEGQ